ncbi:MAG: ABC transporter permease [Thermoplasmata archaeon]|nr:ABC transporter permease [Thermoplasmata archaeon]
MRMHKQVWVITKTMFKAWIRYPENTMGTLIYLGIVGVFAYVLMLSNLLTIDAVPYYIVGLTIFAFIGQSNSVYINFSVWREELLAKPVKPDIFLLSVYFGGLLTSALPMLLLFFLSIPFYWESLHMAPFLLLISLFLGILSSLGMCYLFASLGLRFRPEGYIVTSLTFVFTFLCGILVPVYLLPRPMVYVSYIIPYTWSIDLFRHSILSTPTISPLNQELLILVVSTAVYLFLGKLFLMRTLKAIRVKKVIIK